MIRDHKKAERWGSKPTYFDSLEKSFMISFCVLKCLQRIVLDEWDTKCMATNGHFQQIFKFDEIVICASLILTED